MREWLRRAADAQRPRGLPDGSDTWTEIDLDYSSPEEVRQLKPIRIRLTAIS